TEVLTKVDSLILLLKTDHEDTSKVNHLNDLGWELMYQNPDTSIILGKRALALSKKLRWEKGIANSYGNFGAYNYLKGDYPKALDYYFKALKLDDVILSETKNLSEKQEVKNKIAAVLGNIGLVYSDQGDYPKALDYYFKALKIAEELGNKNGIAGLLGNIGIVYIEEIHKEVTDSINYAKRIQEAVLPVSESARSILPEHFILFKPKDIVSGDFYWTTRVVSHVSDGVTGSHGFVSGTMPASHTVTIITVADCTGHGVPGAFMCMLSISFLTEIVRKQELTLANQVLNELRKAIINALQQKGVSGEQKDGMDISLLVVNTKINECQWAGANNSLYLIQTVASQPFELKEIKGDKMPIAIHPVMNDFTNHQFKVEKGDCLYLFSDGFADQFGGPKGKKLKYSAFKKIIAEISVSPQARPMKEQGEQIEMALEKWMNFNGKKYEQIDDITVLGIRI
ncbi:MAG: SpoIIE family protein phosphatase, partial [Bacteroidia bacterium]|nr:SpoIIE family protein phosphatase [Bacteroidia bacterium]